MAFMTVDGVMLHVRKERNGDARPLVFINSLGTDFRIWHGVAHALRDAGFQFLFYDKRGHGLSEVGEPPWSMERHVSDLAAIMDAYGLREAIVCGISVGGQVALGLHGSRPDLVSALILCDTAHRIGTNEAWDARIAKVAAEGIASVWPMTEKAWFTERYRQERAADVAGWRSMVTRCPVGGYIGTCMAIRDTDYTDIAKNVSVPSLALCGAEDGSTPPALVKGMADIIPGCRYVEVGDAAHMICIEQPEETARLIAEFAQANGLS